MTEETQESKDGAPNVVQFVKGSDGARSKDQPSNPQNWTTRDLLLARDAIDAMIESLFFPKASAATLPNATGVSGHGSGAPLSEQAKSLMSAEIVDFTTRHRTPGADHAPRKAAGTLTTTMKNEHLRSARREAWCKADALTKYWRALVDFTDAVSRAKSHGLTEARAHTETGYEARWALMNRYREALGKHLLTPAPDVVSVNWKRRQLSKDPYIGVKKELVEKAIADDIAFLDARPTRNSRANKLRKGEARAKRT